MNKSLVPPKVLAVVLEVAIQLTRNRLEIQDTVLVRIARKAILLGEQPENSVKSKRSDGSNIISQKLKLRLKALRMPAAAE